MNLILSGVTDTRYSVYLDDIVIYARSLTDHNTKLQEVLGCECTGWNCSLLSVSTLDVWINASGSDLPNSPS